MFIRRAFVGTATVATAVIYKTVDYQESRLERLAEKGDTEGLKPLLEGDIFVYRCFPNRAYYLSAWHVCETSIKNDNYELVKFLIGQDIFSRHDYKALVEYFAKHSNNKEIFTLLRGELPIGNLSEIAGMYNRPDLLELSEIDERSFSKGAMVGGNYLELEELLFSISNGVPHDDERLYDDFEYSSENKHYAQLSILTYQFKNPNYERLATRCRTDEKCLRIIKMHKLKSE